MPVHVPHLSHGKALQSKTAKKAASGHGKKSTYAELMLTPMIDMFVLLTVFLLGNFAASGEILAMSKDIVLPQSQSIKQLDRLTVVAITSTNVSCEGEVVADTEDLIRTSDMRIPALTDKLTTLKENYNLLHRNTGDVFKGDLIIQSDQAIDFKVVKKIMFAAVEAGYLNFNYAVLQKGKGAAVAP